MTAVSRIGMKFVGMGFAAAMMAAHPVAAQNNDQPVDVTAAPPPSSDSVGPAQLRDFSLGGTTTRPAQTAPATTAPTTAPATGATSPATPRPAAPTTAPAASPASPQSSPARVDAPVTSAPSAGAAPSIEQDEVPRPSVGTDPSESIPADVAAPDLAPADASQAVSIWPWVAAFAAAIVAAGAFWWTRRSRDQRVADPGRMAFAGAVREQDVPQPAPRAVQPTPQPTPPTRAPEPVPTPAPVAPPVAAPRSDGLITSSALKPSLTLQLRPEKLVLTETNVTLHFDLAIENVGAGPARDVLIEAIMVTASVRQDQEIADFFQKPRSESDRIPIIAPLDTLPLKSIVQLPIDRVQHFEAGGRALFVPLIAFNLVYRSGAEERQNSASFMIGRGGDSDEKLAPFRLDLGPRIFRDLSARAHSAGLSG